MQLLITAIILTLVTTVILTLMVLKIVFYKRITITDLLALLVLIVITIIYSPQDQTLLAAVYSCLGILILGLSLFYFIEIVRLNNVYQRRLSKYLKDSEYDFYLQVNKKNIIRDFSLSLLKTTGLKKTDVMKKECWQLLFDAFEIIYVNKMEATTTNYQSFTLSVEEAISKFKTYQFEIIIILKDKPITFKGIIEPLYLGNYLVGRNIYFYVDRTKNVELLQHELQNAICDIERLRNQNHAMMSLYDGAVLYFDFESKLYIATESFCRFTNTHQREYTFTELVEYIHPDDLDSYIEQSETINSLSVTRLKFRLLVNDTYYYVIEDSIYLNSDTDLVSIIRIIDPYEETNLKTSFSTKEATKIIESLNCTNISQVIEKTENILTTVVPSTNEETNVIEDVVVKDEETNN